jgi:P27 family predicted phage terminase small subunit
MSARIPDADHKIKGTRPTRAADNGQDIPAGRPKFPKGLTPEAKVTFKLLCRQLAERRALTAGDMQILHLYAEQWLRWVNARAQVATLGEVVTDTRLDSNGGAHEVLRKNPWLTVVETCETKMHAILRDLGLTPNARAKVKQVGDKPKPAATPEEEFFSGIGQPAAAPGSASLLADLDDFETGVTQ